MIGGGKRGWIGTGVTESSPGRDMGGAKEGCALDESLEREAVDSRRG